LLLTAIVYFMDLTVYVETRLNTRSLSVASTSCKL